jgi:MYXO-CTERM domain-containing protein
VTPIDVVGGRRWVIRANHIHDHAKGQGDNVSYAAFLKGNSRDGLFERNLVECEKLHAGQVRLGLSFGGGGSGPDPICEDGDCSVEHQGGVMRNNIIANCPADVGIYVNEGVHVQILHNTLIHTAGIDVRFAVSSATLSYNLLDGQIRGRDGATLSQTGNLASANLAAIFTAPGSLDLTLLDGSPLLGLGAPLGEVPDDFCRNARDDGQPDLGAVEYDGDGPCDTSRTHSGPPQPVDAGPVSDTGGTGTDASTARDAVVVLSDAWTGTDADLRLDGAVATDRATTDGGPSLDRTSPPLDAAAIPSDAALREAGAAHDASTVKVAQGCRCDGRDDPVGTSWLALLLALAGAASHRRRASRQRSASGWRPLAPLHP